MYPMNLVVCSGGRVVACSFLYKLWYISVVKVTRSFYSSLFTNKLLTAFSIINPPGTVVPSRENSSELFLIDTRNKVLFMF